METTRGVSRCAFYGNHNWTLFLRAHLILCERLNAIRELCGRRLADYEHEQRRQRERRAEFERHGYADGYLLASSTAHALGVGGALSAASGESANPSRLYNDALDMVKLLLDQNVDQVAYEDVLRSMFGADAFPLFTMDKLLAVLAKHLTALVADAPTIVTFNLFKAFVSRRALVATDKHAAEELVYEFLSASVRPRRVGAAQTSYHRGSAGAQRLDMHQVDGAQCGPSRCHI